ncbi:hypothetical protein PUN28_004621 [Cardiocondyla obscurior]|uniref:Uncharacterized protein n=1 Tax=Cardiocondyla obscurior TaxID=286306 RepID=A0AAW2GGU6_9HYME
MSPEGKICNISPRAKERKKKKSSQQSRFSIRLWRVQLHNKDRPLLIKFSLDNGYLNFVEEKERRCPARLVDIKRAYISTCVWKM